jgi:L,D-transpeptidase ErfK/SrfK
MLSMSILIRTFSLSLATFLLAASHVQANDLATKIAPALQAPATENPAEPIVAIGELQTTTTRYEDTLIHLARKYGVGFVEIRSANPGVDPWLPGSGTKITIPTWHILPDAPHKGVVINLSEMRLYYYQNPGEAPATYAIGIGRAGLTTPLGTTTVARKTVDPIWVPTDRMRREDPKLPAVVPPGPENPMGTHAMYLGWNSYAIHGTDKPYSIGRRLSSGCIRMYPEDILTLYNNLPQGSMVTVVDQPIKVGWIDNKFYIEAHATQEQADILSRDNDSMPDYQMSEKDMRIILKAAGPAADNLDWTKIRKAVKERRGIPLQIGSRSAYDTIAKKSKADKETIKAAEKMLHAAVAADKTKTAKRILQD